MTSISHMNTSVFKDIALLATAAVVMGGLAIAPSAPTIASTVREKVDTAYSEYVPADLQQWPNLPTADQAFDVIGRDHN